MKCGGCAKMQALPFCRACFKKLPTALKLGVLSDVPERRAQALEEAKRHLANLATPEASRFAKSREHSAEALRIIGRGRR